MKLVEQLKEDIHKGESIHIAVQTSFQIGRWVVSRLNVCTAADM